MYYTIITHPVGQDYLCKSWEFEDRSDADQAYVRAIKRHSDWKTCLFHHGFCVGSHGPTSLPLKKI